MMTMSRWHVMEAQNVPLVKKRILQEHVSREVYIFRVCVFLRPSIVSISCLFLFALEPSKFSRSKRGTFITLFSHFMSSIVHISLTPAASQQTSPNKQQCIIRIHNCIICRTELRHMPMATWRWLHWNTTYSTTIRLIYAAIGCTRIGTITINVQVTVRTTFPSFIGYHPSGISQRGSPPAGWARQGSISEQAPATKHRSLAPATCSLTRTHPTTRMMIRGSNFRRRWSLLFSL